MKRRKRPLSISGAPMAAHAPQAIARCRELGARIVIVTAQHESALRTGLQRRFLSLTGVKEGDALYSRTDGTIPVAGSYKGEMLEHLRDTVKDPARVIFFDDQPPNLLEAQRRGFKVQLVNGTGEGISRREFLLGLGKVGYLPEVCAFDIDATLTDESVRRSSYLERYVPEGSERKTGRRWVSLLATLLLLSIVLYSICRIQVLRTRDATAAVKKDGR